MQGIYELVDYNTALTAFNESKDWGCLKNVHLQKTHQKCPICEVKLDNSVERDSKAGKTLLIATIDHYRPQKFYGFLSNDHKNFILMCSDCNNCYKGNEFPLYPPGSKRASSQSELDVEKPLLVNPIIDDPLTLFILIFKLHSNGSKTLELKPKNDLNTYLLEKAKTTIQLFNLGDCDITTHHNVHKCRISTHQINFELFYNLAKARNNKKKFALTLKNKPQLKEYGFFKFIMSKQFKIEILG